MKSLQKVWSPSQARAPYRTELTLSMRIQINGADWMPIPTNTRMLPANPDRISRRAIAKPETTRRSPRNSEPHDTTLQRTDPPGPAVGPELRLTDPTPQ